MISTLLQLVLKDFADIFGRIAGDTIHLGDFCGDSSSTYQQEVGMIIEDVEAEVRDNYLRLVSSSADEETTSKYRDILLVFADTRIEPLTKFRENIHNIWIRPQLGHSRDFVDSCTPGAVLTVSTSSWPQRRTRCR